MKTLKEPGIDSKEMIPPAYVARRAGTTTLHCEKSLFVLASRQKIPVLRKENPAVSTRTIFLLPIKIFKITHAIKATAVKFWPDTTDTAGKFRPSGLWRETF